MQKITPCLWFDNNAEEAMNFYMSVFRDSTTVKVMHKPASAPGSTGGVLAMTVRLDGQEISALNGGPHFAFTPAISLFVTCDTQVEVDRYWEMLSAGGERQRCGWLRDKYGVTWQIVPAALSDMLRDPDAGKADRVMQAMLTMDKIDIDRLTQAFNS